MAETSDIQIRLATDRDAAAVQALSAVFNAGDPTSSVAKQNADINEAILAELLWVAVDEGTVIGYQLCQLFSKDHLTLPSSVFLSELFVLPTYRRRGVGRQLVDTALSAEYPQEFTKFSLTHDPAEKHLTDYFASFGFIARGQTPAGNIKMIRERSA